MEIEEIIKNKDSDQITAVIGCGWVGMLTGGILAHKNRTRDYVFIDVDKERLEKIINKEELIYEPSFYTIFNPLYKLSEKTEYGYKSHGNIIGFTNNYEILKYCNIIYISVNTPDKHGSCDLSYLLSTVEGINKYAPKSAAIVIKSTVEVGTTAFLEREKLRKDLHVFNIPEFLAEGEAINELLKPQRIVIGYTDKDKEGFDIVKQRIIYELTEAGTTNSPVILTDSNTSELIKLSSNFMLAQRVATINAIEALAKEKGANIMDISHAVGLDKRIGDKFLLPSAGFGGSCFRKDINNISNICSNEHYKAYFKSVNNINDYHMQQVAEQIGENKNILFLGYGFKENTNDTRESPTQFIINCLPYSVKFDIYDIHINPYTEKPTDLNKYDYILLMLNEQEYKDIAAMCDKTKIINPRYINIE